MFMGIIVINCNLFHGAIHSFILDVEDELIMEHFTVEELEEIEGITIPEVPDISDEIDDYLGKFFGKVINISITRY